MAELGEANDLHRPLGIGTDSIKDVPAHEIPYAKYALAGCALIGFSLMAFVYVTDKGHDGEPFAVARIAAARKPDVLLAPAASASDTASTVADSGDRTSSIDAGRRQISAIEVEARSGVKVVRQGGETPGALIIQVESPLTIHLNSAPDKRLIEKTTSGLLPKIGADGARASDVYARPVLTAAKIKPGAPRIAIIVGGLGLNPGGTSDAAASLPGAVTLGFAPYGPDLEKQVSRARDVGHEVILQVPMEPFDYPANDPGPHTLTAAAAPAQTLDHLRWHLGRFTGYVGISNFLGGKFMGDTTAFGAVLREIGTRGLMFFDDGTSARSLTAAVSTSLGVSSAVADVAIDSDSRPEAMDAALTQLETIARARGSAIGSAQALPASVEKIARFARGLEARGIVLVPVSALAGRASAVAERPRTP